MQLVAKSDHSTGNSTFASYVLRSNDLVFIFTAPYGTQTAGDVTTTPQPWFKQDTAFAFLQHHGLGVRAVGMVFYNCRPLGQPLRLHLAHTACQASWWMTQLLRTTFQLLTVLFPSYPRINMPTR